MSYTQNKDGYAIEATFGTSVITGAGSTAYLMGLMSERCDWPDTEWQVIQAPPAVNARESADATLSKQIATTRGMVAFGVLDGVFLYLGMGLSSTAGVGPYTHTITPTTDGSKLPSITLQHEESGSGTAEQYQWAGVKVDSMQLHHNLRDGFLMAKMELLAKQPSDPAFALTNDPALPATANDEVFVTLTRNWDTAGTNTSIEGLVEVNVMVKNGLYPIHSDSWSAGAYTGQWPHAFGEAPLKDYRIELVYHPDTIERELWDDAITRGIATKTAVFKWSRSTNDYIQLTATDCAVLSNSKHTEKAGELKLETCIIQPRALSWEVKDSIAGGAYGE